MRYTLLTDGASDRVLMPILEWLLANGGVHAPAGNWADLRRLPKPPKVLAERIQRALDLYPCDVLFVHRDAEGQPRDVRAAEIRAAMPEEIDGVCVVPVRMQEAWLLFDETAIREAAGWPSGRVDLQLPPLRHTEAANDPKELLHSALRKASGLQGRRLKQFEARSRVYRLATLIQDYAPLRKLSAFAAVEADLRAVLASGLDLS